MVYKLLDIDIIDKFIDYIYQYLNEYISSNKKSQWINSKNILSKKIMW